MAFEKTQEQIDNLKTLQLSLSELTDDVNELAPKIEAVDDIVTELKTGKQSIVDAITNVGGEASADESLSELAQDIEQMPIVNVSAFKFSEVPNLAKQIAEQTYTGQLGADFRTKLIEINDANGEITSVGSYAFQNCTNLEMVNLPNVTSVGSYAFQNCTSLKTLNIPECTTIGTYGLRNIKSLKTLNIPNFLYTSATGCLTDGRLEYLTIGSVNTAGIFSSGSVQSVGSESTILEVTVVSSISISLDGWTRQNTTQYLFHILIKFSIPNNTDLATFNNTYWKADVYLVNTESQWENHLTLYTNLLEYTLKRLYDHSQDGVTRTFRLGFYNTLAADAELTTEPYGSYYTPLIKAKAQECLDYMNDINWAFSA